MRGAMALSPVFLGGPCKQVCGCHHRSQLCGVFDLANDGWRGINASPELSCGGLTVARELVDDLVGNGFDDAAKMVPVVAQSGDVVARGWCGYGLSCMGVVRPYHNVTPRM